MVKPVKRKFQCNECKEDRWVESFGGYKYSELDESSVCEYCHIRSEYRGEIAALRGLVTSMQSDFVALKKQLEGHKSQCRCTQLDVPVPPKVTPEDTGDTASAVVRAPLEEKKKNKKKKKKNSSVARDSSEQTVKSKEN